MRLFVPMQALRLLPLTVVLFAGCQWSTQSPIPSGAAATGTVTFEIQHGDSTESFRIEEVADGTTLESLMRSIDEVEIVINGSGRTAFVDQIGGTSMSNSRAWTFRVDGEFANEGIGTTKLSPPTTITWTFGDSSEIASDMIGE